jgi:hypothetical protein
MQTQPDEYRNEPADETETPKQVARQERVIRKVQDEPADTSADAPLPEDEGSGEETASGDFKATTARRAAGGDDGDSAEDDSTSDDATSSGGSNKMLIYGAAAAGALFLMKGKGRK